MATMKGSVLAGLTAVAGSIVAAHASEDGGSRERGGDGESNVSGYTVSEVNYQLSGDGTAHGVRFELDGAARIVVARFNDETATCRPVGEWAWECALPSGGTPLASLVRFGVVASDR